MAAANGGARPTAGRRHPGRTGTRRRRLERVGRVGSLPGTGRRSGSAVGDSEEKSEWSRRQTASSDVVRRRGNSRFSASGIYIHRSLRPGCYNNVRVSAMPTNSHIPRQIAQWMFQCPIWD